MRTASLSSGSKGNSVFVESAETRILIDDGLSLTNIESRLRAIDVDPTTIDAILLTHEHTDHIGGIKFFLKKHRNAKVYIPSFVKDFCLPGVSGLPYGQIEWFSSSDFFIKDITVSCFVLPHDSHFCVGYSLYFDGRKISYATDLGFVSDNTLKSLAGSDILFLESNHDENLLLQNPKYPAKTKKRILGDHGHLSNTSCAKTIAQLVPTGVKQVVLSHLSEENNTPTLAYTTIKNYLKTKGIEEGKNVCVDVAYQNKVGTVFTL